MTFSRPLAVAATAVLLAGGMITADAATTTDPVELCYSTKSRAVSVPKGDTCPKGSTLFTVGSQADVAALATAVDALRADLPTYTTVQEVRAYTAGNNGSGATPVTARCPSGSVATGGGYRLSWNPTRQDLEVAGSYGTVPMYAQGEVFYVPPVQGEPAVAWTTVVSFTNDSSGEIVVTANCAETPAD